MWGINNEDEALIKELEDKIFDCEIEIEMHKNKIGCEYIIKKYEEDKIIYLDLLMQTKRASSLKDLNIIQKKVDNLTNKTNKLISIKEIESHNKILFSLQENDKLYSENLDKISTITNSSSVDTLHDNNNIELFFPPPPKPKPQPQQQQEEEEGSNSIKIINQTEDDDEILKSEGNLN